MKVSKEISNNGEKCGQQNQIWEADEKQNHQIVALNKVKLPCAKLI